MHPTACTDVREGVAVAAFRVLLRMLVLPQWQRIVPGPDSVVHAFQLVLVSDGMPSPGHIVPAWPANTMLSKQHDRHGVVAEQSHSPPARDLTHSPSPAAQIRGLRDTLQGLQAGAAHASSVELTLSRNARTALESAGRARDREVEKLRLAAVRSEGNAARGCVLSGDIQLSQVCAAAASLQCVHPHMGMATQRSSGRWHAHSCIRFSDNVRQTHTGCLIVGHTASGPQTGCHDRPSLHDWPQPGSTPPTAKIS